MTEKEAFLIEAVSIAEEIMEKGSGEGRGIRLAALVIQLNEAMMEGNIPLSWRPSASPGEVAKVMFPLPPPVPRMETPTVRPLIELPRAEATLDMGDYKETLRPPRPDAMFSDDEVAQLNAEWDNVIPEDA